ncbi:phage terminase small subunit [Pseudomonas flexibilis]|uniref:Terminase endonuclease subunit n=1 Tax=Pseudomonas flexibilis TaxID=706570 RepID=A0A0B3BVL2_9PSED|nr:phage terminase small subunit [Pseudomonas flexibilis]KHO66660.1 terminase endonuclease subunit [Pseudomonas flexibilis]SCY30865.1 Phage small terminase subunit [Pseudomonas flexibilis]
MLKPLSPAQRVQLRKRAAQEAAAAAPATSMAGATSYELQLAQLHQDRHRLKQIQSTEGKIELKRQLVPHYAPYIDGVLSAGVGAQDEVLATLMVWCFDIGDWHSALPLARYVLEHKLPMPDRFARTPGTLVAEEIAEAALKALKLGQPFELAVLEQTEELTREQDMPDQARAKLHLALARVLLGLVPDESPTFEQLIQLNAAHSHVLRAIELHQNCGGKKDLERATRLLKKHATVTTEA